MGAAVLAYVGREAHGAGRVVLFAVFVLPLAACGVWVAARGARLTRSTEIVRARATNDGVELRAAQPRLQRPISVPAGSQLKLARVDEAKGDYASWERGVHEYELLGAPGAWKVESPVALTSAMIAPLRAFLASHSIDLRADAGRDASAPVPEASAVLPGQPQDVTVVADMGQASLRAYRKSDKPRDPKRFVLGAPIAWNSSAPTLIRITVDQPEYFNPDAVPAWDLRKPADMLAIDEFGGLQQVAVPVPGGFSEVHAYVMRRGTKPRVVIYLKPLSDTPSH